MISFLKNLFKREIKPIHEIYPEIIEWNIGDSINLWFKYGSKYEWQSFWEVVNIVPDGIIVQQKYDKNDFGSFKLKFVDFEDSSTIKVKGKVYFIDQYIKVLRIKNSNLFNSNPKKKRFNDDYYKLLKGIKQYMDEANNNSLERQIERSTNRKINDYPIDEIKEDLKAISKKYKELRSMFQ